MIKDNTISILTPTRNRPNNCERFIKSIYNTAKNPGNIELHFYVDNDDPSLEAYKSLAKLLCTVVYFDVSSITVSLNIFS